MADIYNFNIETGLIHTDALAVLAEVADEYREVFGADLVVPDSLNINGASTPQGMLIVTEALGRIAMTDNNAAIANQINPNISGGIFLDALLALTGLQRQPATNSTLTATFTGVASTFIPEGSQARTANGDLFETTADFTIPQGGVLTNVTMQSVEYGAIPCIADGLTQGEGGAIVSNILGWETVGSNTEASLGRATQSDSEVRSMRQETLGLQGSSVAEAIMSRVRAVTGVTSLIFRENPSGSSETIDGVTITAHSIYLCVSGGTDLAVAEALVSRKSAGANYYNGASANNVSQNVTIPFSGQVQTVKFDRPDLLVTDVKLTVKILTPLADPETAIKQAVLQYVNGEIDGLAGLVVGQSVSPFEIAGGVMMIYPGVFVQKVEVKNINSSDTFVTTEISTAIFEQAVVTANDIEVVI